MNVRLTTVAAIAVLLTSLSLSAVISAGGWIGIAFGAIAVVAAAGLLTRQPKGPAAIAITVLVLIAVVPLLTRPGLAGPIAGLAIIAGVALAATVLRLLRGIAILAAYLAALLLYLDVVFAHALAYGDLVPSTASMTALGRLWQAAGASFNYAPPVPDAQAINLVTAAGIGAVAIAVDIVAVRLRRPAIAGVPLLVLFSVPIASNLKVFGFPQMIVFAAALAGYLALLSADGRQRLRIWGRLVTFRHVQSPAELGSGPNTRELAASGRRIGLAAVCLAIVIPAILPAMHAHAVFGTTPDGSGSGGTDGISPLLKVQSLLAGKPQPVLRYTTTAADPREQYFQVYALNYNARQNRWLQASESARTDRPLAGETLPWRAAGVARGTPATTVTTRVDVSKDDGGDAILPMPYAPVRLEVGGTGWQQQTGSLTVFSDQMTMPSLRYTVVSKEADPKATQIPDAFPPASVAQQYAGYTGPDSRQLLGIAEKHTPGATTDLQEALDLQRWFLSGAFSYTLKPNLPAGNWLLTFLTTDRHGFCSQFAQAFAVLARELGIPSRVAIGYTGGSLAAGHTWQVTTADAHAWPELYFAGEGWLRFEPTPSGSRGQGTAAVPAYAGGLAASGSPAQTTLPGAGSTGPALPSAAGPGRTAANRLVHPADTGSLPAAAAPGSDLGLAIGIPVAVFLFLAWPALIRIGTRRRRWLAARGDAGTAHAAWRELIDDLADYGVPCSRSETPRAVARRLSSDVGLEQAATQAVDRISRAEEHARYAPAALPATGLRADVATVRRAIARRTPWRDRLRARLLPASTLRAARQLGQGASEVLSWLDSSWPAVRRQVRALAHR